MSPRRDRFVVLSGYHDYRSGRKVDLHFVADELAKDADVFFLSLRYSRMTRRREDPRHALWDRANAFETVRGVECYLWRTPVHPCRLPPAARLAERALFGLFARYLPAGVRDRIEPVEQGIEQDVVGGEGDGFGQRPVHVAFHAVQPGVDVLDAPVEQGVLDAFGDVAEAGVPAGE